MPDFSGWGDLEKAISFSAVMYFTLAWYIHRLQGRVDELKLELLKLQKRD